MFHHHHVPPARISLTLSRHFSLSFIASGRSSGLHSISSQSCCMYVRAGHPGFPRPYVGVHRSTSFMSSSLLLQQCPACLVRLTWIVFVMGSRWPYSWCFVGCCLQDLFNSAGSILVSLPSIFFSSCFVHVQVVHLYSTIDTTAAWKKLRFILLVRSDFHMIDSLSIAVHDKFLHLFQTKNLYQFENFYSIFFSSYCFFIIDILFPLSLTAFFFVFKSFHLANGNNFYLKI